MSATRITIDYALAMGEGIGEDAGISDAQLDELAPRFADACHALLQRTASGEIGFLDLPHDHSGLAQVRRVRASLSPDLSDVLVLGIGGSSLGTRALLEA